MCRRPCAAVAATAWLLCVPGVTPAQRAPRDTAAARVTVRSGEGLPVGGAQVQLGAGAAAESDDAGVAMFARVPPGDAWLRVRRIGYRPESLQVTVVAGRRLDTMLVLRRLAVDLAPVTILGRRDVQGPLAGFYQRMATGGGGRYFTRADIQKRSPARMTELLRDVPGIRIEAQNSMQNTVRIRGSRCAPMVYLDGQGMFAGEVDLDSFDPLTFEGIEVYSGAATTPVEFQRNLRTSSNCGTILLWSRRGEPRTKSSRDGLSPAARIAQLLDSLKVYTEADVDVAALMDSSELVRPVYPDSLYDARTPGLVLAEFVVGADGEVVIETFSAVTATHRDFVDPVRRALREQRFVPAVRQGRKVQQVVQQPFRFVPDSTARRRR